MNLYLSIAAVYTLMSAITFVTYAIDKHRAKTHRWRIPERTLHLLALAGGWPGALAAQSLFRHKRQKKSFMFICAAIVLMHIVAWALWMMK